MAGGAVALVLFALPSAVWSGAAHGAGLAEPPAATFLAPVAFDSGEYGPTDIERADLNNDGLLDLAVFTIGNGGNVQFMIGDGNKRLQKSNTLVVSYGRAVASGDFNNDGRRDLVVTQAASSGVTRYVDLYCDPASPAADYPAAIVFLGVAGGTPFPSPSGNRIAPSACLYATSSSTSLTDAVAGNFDGDGNLDLAVGSASSGVRVYRGNGDGTFMAPVQAVFPGYASTSAKPYMGSNMTAVDMDVDGRLDVVADLGGSPAILRNTGDGSVAHPLGQLTYFRTYGLGSNQLPYSSSFQSFGIGDFNGDGIPDVAGVQGGATSVGGPLQFVLYVSLGTGNIGNGLVDPGEENPNVGDTARFLPDLTSPAPSFPGFVAGGQFDVGGTAVADFNRDGLVDLAVVHRDGNSVVLYLGYGNGALTAGSAVTVGPAGQSPRLAAAGDWNRDNWADLAVVDYGNENGGNARTWVLTQIPGVVTDAAPPAVTLTAPTGGSIVQGPVPLTASATDNTSVSRVEFYRGSNLIATDTVAPYEAVWSTGVLPNGTYTLTAKAYDPANNPGTSAAVVVTLANPDTTAPVVTATALPAQSWLAATPGQVALTATATDLNGVTNVEFYYGSTLIGSDATAPYSLSWNTDGVPAGSYAITARAYDPAVAPNPANFGTSPAVTVVVDRPPTAGAGSDQLGVEATGPDGAPVTLAGTGLDPDAGDTLTYRWSDGFVLLGTTATLSVTAPLGDSTYFLEVTDSHGAVAQATVAVSVTDTTGPVIDPLPDLELVATGPAGAQASFEPSATDLVQGPVTDITCLPASGETFPLGLTAVTCTATDRALNTSTAGFTVTVVPAEPAGTLAPGAVVFADQRFATTSAPRVVTLSSTGGVPLDVLAVTTSGEFAVTSGCPLSLAVGATCDLAVRFTPLGNLTRSGRLTVTTSAGVLTTALSGVGSGIEPKSEGGGYAILGAQKVRVEWSLRSPRPGAVKGKMLVVRFTQAGASYVFASTLVTSLTVTQPGGTSHFEGSGTLERNGVLVAGGATFAFDSTDVATPSLGTDTFAVAVDGPAGFHFNAGRPAAQLLLVYGELGNYLI